MADDLRLHVYIDGGYVRTNLERIGAKWGALNLLEFARVCVSKAGNLSNVGRISLRRVFVYDAGDSAEVDDWLTANNRLSNVHVRHGHLAGDGKRRRQKGVDIRLAVDALRDAYGGACDVVLIVSGDADFEPLLDALRTKGPQVLLCAFSETAARELIEQADAYFGLWEDAAVYKGWQLPDLTRSPA
jgi:uncharacterized LabA/DUF88 family protein